MKASAIVLKEFNKPLEVKHYPLPDKIEPEAVLVKVLMAGVCGTDVHLWHGQLPIPLPVILGHETVGKIAALGSNVKTDWTGNPLKVGDRVTWSSAILCGECYYCRVAKQPTRCVARKVYGVNITSAEKPHLLGGYAEYVYLKPRSAIFKLPRELPTESVIGAGCAIVTAIHGIERIGVKWMDRVVIQGAGPVGLACLAVAKDSSAQQVIVLEGSAKRIRLAERFGCDHVIDINKFRTPQARIAKVKKLTGGYGADVVLECVGIPNVVPEGLEMCRDGGRYLILGHYGDAGTVMFNPHVVTRKQLQVFGSWASEPRHMLKAIEFINEKRRTYPFEKVVSHRFSLTRANEALQIMAKWAATKAVITPTEGKI